MAHSGTYLSCAQGTTNIENGPSSGYVRGAEMCDESPREVSVGEMASETGYEGHKTLHFAKINRMEHPLSEIMN